LFQLSCAQEDEGDEFVRQVLQEEEAHYETTHTTEPDSHTEQARLEAEAFQKAQEEQIARERAEQIRLQREAQFEAELARMNEEQQKAAKKQKKKDAKIVRQILNADRKRRLYAVLGVKNYDIHIGPWTILNTDSATIKRAYRTRARAVHPDRNRDGRAQEAFIAVENAASILADEAQRQVYDEEVRLKRQQQRNEMKQAANTVKNSIGKYINRVTWVFRRIFGPFATPIFILGCLMA
jgi:curved DNA-binding protein CbpA